jgi:CubicO group peptidase (beta-lactamase class C family)
MPTPPDPPPRPVKASQARRASPQPADERRTAPGCPTERLVVRFSAMQSLQDAVEGAAECTGFSGVVRLDRSGENEFSTAYGFADRAHGVLNTVETLFATASGSKGLTALAVMSLVERRMLELGTTARSLLGKYLPLIANDVTIEQLLAHRSGIGDYLDARTPSTTSAST